MKKLLLILLFVFGFLGLGQNNQVLAGHPEGTEGWYCGTYTQIWWDKPDGGHEGWCTCGEDCGASGSHCEPIGPWNGYTNDADCFGGGEPTATPTPIPPSPRNIEIWSRDLQANPLISGPDEATVELYAKSANAGVYFWVNGTWGVDFRTGPDPGVATYFTSPSPQINRNVWITDSWTPIGTFRTQVRNDTGQCLTDISGRVSVRPFFSGDANVITSTPTSKDNVINIGAMIGRLRVIRSTDLSPVAGASVIFSPHDNAPGGSNYTTNDSGEVTGVNRLNCRRDDLRNHTITASWNGWTGSTSLRPTQSGDGPQSDPNNISYLCNGTSIGLLNLKIYPPGVPTPTPTPPLPTPTPAPGCGTPPGGGSWRWKDSSVGYICSTSRGSCSSDACVGEPWQCQNGTWVRINPGECSTVCSSFCGSAPTPTTQPGCDPITVTASPSTVSPGSPITISARSSYPYGNTGINTGGGTGGETQPSYCCDPSYTWRWYYNATNTTGTYTATFSGRKGGLTCTASTTYNVGGGSSRLYVVPTSGTQGQNFTVTATATTSCSSDVGKNFGNGLTNCRGGCGDGGVTDGCTCSGGNPTGDGNPCWWRWSCSGSNTGSYTASFYSNSNASCSANAPYTVTSSCPASPPTNLAPNTTNSFTPTTSTVTLSWNSVVNATRYAVRVDDDIAGNDSGVNGPVADNCGANPHDICIEDWGSTSMNISVVPGRRYRWWVHASAPGCGLTDYTSAVFSVFQGYHDGNGGNSDLANCRADGWAYDPDGGQAQIRVYRGGVGTPVANGTANQYRSDLATSCQHPNNPLNGNCSFNVSLDGGPPGLIPYNSDQQITVKAVDVQSSTEITLNTTPKTLNCGDATPWWQTRLGDVRAGGSSLTDRIPSSCVGACTPVVSLTNNSAGLVTYKTPPTSDFGSGTASSPNWRVDSSFGGSSFSYEVVNAKLGSSATLFNPSSLPTTTGNYKATGDTTIPAGGGAWTIGAGQKLVVLIEGNLIINKQIAVPAGSYLAFFASGDISVDPSLGTTHNNDSSNQLEGIYAANGSFRTGQTVTCNPGNNRLNIGGTVVADADLNGSGNISQQRCLGPRDNLYPSFYVNYRPDFLLNAPPIVQRPGLVWQEVAP